MASFLIRKQKETCLSWFWELFFSCSLHESKWLMIAKTMDRKAPIKRTKRITRTPRKARARRMKRIIRRWLESTVLDSMVLVRRSCQRKRTCCILFLLQSHPCSPRGNSTKTYQIHKNWNRHHPHTAVQKGLNHRCGNDDQIKCIPPPLRSIKEVVEAKSHNLHDDFLSTNGALFQMNQVGRTQHSRVGCTFLPSYLNSRTCWDRRPNKQAFFGFRLTTYRKRMKGMDSKIFEDRQRFGTLKTEVESETTKAKFTKPSITRSPDWLFLSNWLLTLCGDLALFWGVTKSSYRI